MPNVLFDGLFASRAAAESVFLQVHDDAPLSHREFASLASGIANAFAAAGLVKGDRVALQVNKSPMALAVYAACVRSGVVLLPLNTAYTVSELSYFISDAGPAMFVCDSAQSATLEPLINASNAILHTLDAYGSGTLSVAAQQQSSTHNVVDCGPDDLAAILYTSGTTGRSKGAMLSHANLLSNARSLATLWQFTEQDVLLHALPIFHTHGLFVAVNTCAVSGASMLFHPSFRVESVMRDLSKATALMGVPTFYTRLLDEPAFTRELCSNVRLFVSGSAPLSAETHARFEERTGHRILERYGMTETNMNTSNPYDGERRAGTVGFPLPGVQVHITHPDTGEVVPAGDTGMIEVRGPNVFNGYWKMPEKTAEELRTNGFFITGDLGLLDADGYLHIVGRQKDLIISGGYNIYPKEIETLFDALPGVRESAVIGVPDADFGEAVLAVVVAEPDVDAAPDALLDSIKPQLARFKHPRRVIIVDELPRNTMGKVQKNVLRDQYAS